MTPSEIWRAAQAIAPRIQLRDVWFILRQMQERQLVTCFNPKELTAKVYFWANSRVAFFSERDWRNYAYVIRAKVRRAVLLQLADRGDQAASRVRQSINERYPVSLNAVIRALRDLRLRKLVRVSGEGEKRGQKMYRITAAGRRIAEFLGHRTVSPQSLLNSSSSL
jgi:DNA-binding HxlR family transcriptional regulator